MISVRLVQDRNIARALRRAPRELIEGIQWALRRAALEATRLMKRQAPKAESTLTVSIRNRETGALEQTVGPNVEHGVYVELGTEGGPGRRMPPVDAIEDWVKVRGLAPRRPGDTPRDVAWAIARSIQRDGTRAQPFVRPVREDPGFRRRVTNLVFQGVDRGLRRAEVIR
jgi:hypothetical protein